MIVFNIYDIMEKMNLSEKDLLKKGFNRVTLRFLLTGKNTRIDYSVLNQLCKHLNCQPGDIMKYVPDEG